MFYHGYDLTSLFIRALIDIIIATEAMPVRGLVRYIFLFVAFSVVSLCMVAGYLMLHGAGRKEYLVAPYYRHNSRFSQLDGAAAIEPFNRNRPKVIFIPTALEQKNATVLNGAPGANVTNAVHLSRAALVLPEWLKRKFPHYMIIGFGKAGTRALYDALRMHPQLAGPAKEERYFSLKYSSRGLSQYLKSFPVSPTDGFLMEKSPDYILNPLIPSRIIKAARETGRNVEKLKFIVMTRDPIARAMSEYLEWNILRKRIKSHPLKPFDQMVLEDGIFQSQQPFINTSCYAYHIENWLRTFSQDHMCYVDGDQFVTDPLGQISSLEKCMGLKPYFTQENFVYNKLRGFYCFKKDTLHCLGQSKGREHPPIAPEVRNALSHHFSICNANLPHLVNPQNQTHSDHG